MTAPPLPLQPSGPLPDVTVAIPTCDDDPALLGRVLGAIRDEQIGHPALVVDMSSGTDVRDTVARTPDAARLIPFRESRGVSDSRNRAVLECRTRFLLFIDSDAIPQPGWARAMRLAFEEEPGVAVVGARCLPVWPGRPPFLFTTQPAADFLSLFDLGADPLDVPRIIGTSYALDLGRLPTDPFPVDCGYRPGFPYGGEENALAAAALDLGWHVRYQPEAVVHHVLRAKRVTWRSMLTRVYRAGRESRRGVDSPGTLPRRLTLRDRGFLGLVAPAYLAGRLAGPPDG